MCHTMCCMKGQKGTGRLSVRNKQYIGSQATCYNEHQKAPAECGFMLTELDGHPGILPQIYPMKSPPACQ